jgi:hypothetical protein
MSYEPFTPEEVSLLKTLNNRVLNQLPNLSLYKECIITGPAVAEMAVTPTLSDKDRTFLIFAPDKETFDQLQDSMLSLYSMRPQSFESGYKFLNNKRYMNWFTLEYIDLIAEEILVYENSFAQNKNFIIGIQDPVGEYKEHFKYHPIYCYEGKCYVNRYRLDEAHRYVKK